MNKLVPAEISAQVSQAHIVIEHHLAATLESIHLFGSAVDGGLKPHSDIDLLVTVKAPIDKPVRQALMHELLSISAPPNRSEALRALEVTILAWNEVVPWRYPAKRELQFGEWLRQDILAGIFEPPVIDYDLAILLTKARQHSIALLGSPAALVFEPVPEGDFAKALLDTITQWNSDEDWKGEERNIVLALARVWYSAATNLIAPKDVAARWTLGRLPEEHRSVMQTALSGYLGKEADDLTNYNDQLADFIRYVKLEIEKLLVL